MDARIKATIAVENTFKLLTGKETTEENVVEYVEGLLNGLSEVELGARETKVYVLGDARFGVDTVLEGVDDRAHAEEITRMMFDGELLSVQAL